MNKFSSNYDIFINKKLNIRRLHVVGLLILVDFRINQTLVVFFCFCLLADVSLFYCFFEASSGRFN